MDDILLAIDDDSTFLEILQKVATSVGFAASTTTDPHVFRSTLLGQPPSVVFLDLQMPGCDGIELLHSLAEARCRAKIFVMSGFDARVLAMAVELGLGLGLDMGVPFEKPLRIAPLREVLTGLRKQRFSPTAADLTEALNAGHIELHYHPLVTLLTGKTIGFEALARWRHPDFGMVMPDKFIALAEQQNLMGPLTQRVLDLAAKQIAVWHEAGCETFASVNISAANIVADLPDALARLCVQYGIPTRMLRLELTETAAMGNQALVLEVLTRVRLKGFQLAIDDFGTGYSSLVQLRRLPFTELKIDQSFVRDMAKSEDANIIVNTIIKLGQSLKLDLIAEGIETEDILQRLVALGCHTGQGYLFSRPMPAAQTLDWLADKSRVHAVAK